MQLLVQESEVRKPWWLSCVLMELLTVNKRSLTGHCISLYEPQTLIFHGAGSVHSQSGPLEAVLVVWAQRPTGMQISLLPSLSPGLALHSFHQRIFKACKVWLQWEQKLEMEKVNKRDLVSAWSKKGWLKGSRGKQANCAECSELGGRTVVEAFRVR